MRFSKSLSTALLLNVSLLITACGGGSSNSVSTAFSAEETTSDSTPLWSQGEFPDAGIYKSRCENPRSTFFSGFNSDKPGSSYEEKMWLRSWSDETYLWYNEIIDNDVALFDDVIEYFDQLVTPASTASGNPKDRFHFSIGTSEYKTLISSGAEAGYGASFNVIESSPPRKVVIAYTEPNSPASKVSLMRGAEILEVDGVDVVNGADITTLNNGTFPQSAGESHTFVVRDAGSTESRTITMETEVVTINPVLTTRTINTDTGNIGYIAFNTFSLYSAEKDLYDAFTQLEKSGTDDLVLDLRYNGGGFLAISAQLAYMIAGPEQSKDKVFSRLEFNDKNPTTDPTTGETVEPYPFIDESVGFSVDAGKKLPTLNLKRVYIIATGSTCSASEELINGLRGIGVEVVLIGNTTCGKPYGFQGQDNCGTTFFTIQFRGVNDLGFGDYADGFTPANSPIASGEITPGCSVSDDYLNQLGDTKEGMLNAALRYREDGSCPAVALSRRKTLDQLSESVEGNLFNDKRLRDRLMIKQMLVK